MIVKYREFKKRSKGFTLIELMIVVAIIAILAAIAIPQYKKFQLKSKTSEAKTNLGAIKTCEESYAAEHDVYVQAAATPTSDPTSEKQAWNGNHYGFSSIGFKPAGNVYYQYGVQNTDWTSAANAPGGTDADTVTAVDGQIDIYMCARGDLDGDGTYKGFKVNDESNAITDVGPSDEF